MKNIIIFYIVTLASISTNQCRILDKQNRIVDILHALDNTVTSVTLTLLKNPHIYKATTNANTYVIRFNELAPECLQFLERDIQLYAAEKYFGPKILSINSKEGVIIMDYLENKYDPDNLDNTIPLLVESMKKMHRAPFTGRQLHQFAHSSLRRITSISSSTARGINMDEIYGSLSRFLWLFEDTQDHVLVHGDLHPFNIFLSEENCLFIDFEIVHLDSPFVDLAHLAISYGMNKMQEKKMLNLYFNRQATVEDFIKLTVMKCFVCIKFICPMLESVQNEIITTLIHVPLFRTFIKSKPELQNTQWLYSCAISAVKELEDLLKQLDLCLIGDYSLLLPTDMQTH